MASTSMDYDSANVDRFDEEPARTYDERRSASPRHDEVVERRRSASPANGDRDRDRDRAPPRDNGGGRDGDGDAINPGSNLFVTGIHPRLTEAEVTRMFEKYGEVEKCQIMRDPHTRESRGFGFVKMVTSDQADAAKEGLQGEELEGRTLSIEKARRARPRTPTPGKYFGPPKREGGGGGGGRGGRFDDRRRGGYGGGGGGYGGGRDDPYRYRGYDRRNDDRDQRGYRDDRGYDRGYDRNGGAPREDRFERRDRDDSYGGRDRYRDDRGGDRGYGGPREDRRPPMDRERERGGDRFDRDREGPRSREPPAAGYEGPRGEARESYGERR